MKIVHILYIELIQFGVHLVLASFDMDNQNTSFNSDDETKIFGKRQIAESHGQIFECLTLASFPVNDEVNVCFTIFVNSNLFVFFQSGSRLSE